MDGGSRHQCIAEVAEHTRVHVHGEELELGETASDVVGIDGSTNVEDCADAVDTFEDMFSEQMAHGLPPASSNSVPDPLQDAAADDLGPKKLDDSTKKAAFLLEVETGMKHCGKIINEWNGKVRTYRGTLKRALDHVNTKDCIVANQMTALVKEGDDSLSNLLAVDVKHKGKQPVTKADIATITRESAAIYTTVKSCNKKNAGLVNLFSC